MPWFYILFPLACLVGVTLLFYIVMLVVSAVNYVKLSRELRKFIKSEVRR